MSLECAECERDLRGGHTDDCVIGLRHRAEHAEAQRDRLAAALQGMAAVEDNNLPGWIAYWGDDAASCTFCRSYGGNPYEIDELRDWPHEPGCAVLIARAALADVPDDRARRRDEAYEAMVEALEPLSVMPPDRYAEGYRAGYEAGVTDTKDAQTNDYQAGRIAALREALRFVHHDSRALREIKRLLAEAESGA